MINNPQIETNRLIFTPVTSKEIDLGWLNWINNPNSFKYLETKKATKDELIDYLKRSKPPKCYFFAARLKHNHEYIGNIRLSEINYKNKSCTYGRLLGATSQLNKGFGSEFLQAIQYFSFEELNLKIIYTGVKNENLPSIKSNLKAGMSEMSISQAKKYMDPQKGCKYFCMTVESYYELKKLRDRF